MGECRRRYELVLWVGGTVAKSGGRKMEEQDRRARERINWVWVERARRASEIQVCMCWLMALGPEPNTSQHRPDQTKPDWAGPSKTRARERRRSLVCSVVWCGGRGWGLRADGGWRMVEWRLVTVILNCQRIQSIALTTLDVRTNVSSMSPVSARTVNWYMCCK